MALKMFHILRIGQLWGFAGYYSIPFGSPNAIGYSLFEKIKEECPVAENLG